MNNDIKQILLRYITKQTSVEENTWVKNWIALSEENELAYIKLYEAYHANLSSHHQLIDTEQAYERFLKEQHKPFFRKLNHWYAYAALITAVCAISLLFKSNHYSKAGSWNSITVAKGEKSKYILPDGTKVFVNAGSTLKYNKQFGKHQRKVILDGEAYFDIAKSKNNIPFIVDAAGYIVRDIGTVFKIKAYSEDGDFESLVISGEISVESKTEKNNKIYLTKNQTIKILANTYATNKPEKTPLKIVKPEIKTINISDPDLQPETYNDWTSGTLTFDNTSFEQIINTLEREYNLTIEIADESLKAYHYTGKFKKVTDVYKILEVIKQNTPITYSTSGETILIKKLTKN